MKKGSHTHIIRFIILLGALAVLVTQRNALVDFNDKQKTDSEATTTQGVPAVGQKSPSQAAPKAPQGSSAQPASQAQQENADGTEKVHGYTKFTRARFVPHRNNDGDSFLVNAGGREFELRLYFVDAPEKYYSDRFADQRKRVEEQGRAMGGLSVDQVTATGEKAKAFTENLLKGNTFTVYTYWETVYSGERFYGFVELADGEYLGTKLVKEGLARIHTKGPGSKEKPVPTPDGTAFFPHRDMLRAMEKEARAEKKGAWGLPRH